MDLGYRLPDSVTIMFSQLNDRHQFVMLNSSIAEFFALIQGQRNPSKSFLPLSRHLLMI